MLKEKIKSVLIKINALSYEVNEEQFKNLKAISNELKDCYEIAKEWEGKVLISPKVLIVPIDETFGDVDVS